jgi:hypothetical protein
MRSMLPVYLCMFSGFSLCLSACSGRPEQQIARTDQAMQQAKDEYSQEFAPEEWRTAEDAYNAAQKMLDQKKWREANMLLLKSMTGFQQARNLAKGKREEMIRDIQNSQKTVELRCKALREAYQANLKRIPAAKRKEFEETCNAFEEKLSTISKQLDGGRYQDAKFLAGKTLREVWETRQEMEKLTGKKIT